MSAWGVSSLHSEVYRSLAVFTDKQTAGSLLRSTRRRNS